MTAVSARLRLLGLLVAGLTGVILVCHAWQAVAAGAHLNLVGGAWLALARDLRDGVFYRDLVSAGGYGGTRYFPLFFSALALGLRAGLTPFAAAVAVSACSAVVLAAGLYRMARTCGTPRPLALVVVAAGMAPYVVQQALFEIRADVLATGLNLLGLASVLPAWTGEGRGRPNVAAAGLWFSLALATKVTSLAVPAAVVAALVLSGFVGVAARLAGVLAAGAMLVVGGTATLSAGRAVASWRACLFGGRDGAETLGTVFSGSAFSTMAQSHFLTVAALLAMAAIVLVFVFARRPAAEPLRGDETRGLMWLTPALFLSVTAATWLTLSSPGTIAANQVIELVEVSLVILLLCGRAQPQLARPAAMAVLGLMLWANGQDAVRARALSHAAAGGDTRAAERIAVEAIRRSAGPVLSESPLWPVLAGQRAYVLDPFALRVVAQARPDVLHDLETKLDARLFDRVILQMDPTTPRGQGWYEHVHFGWPIVARILANYHAEGPPVAGAYVYLPNGPGR